MDTLTLKTDKASRISIFIRSAAGMIGLLLAIVSILQYFTLDEPSFWTGFNFAFGLGLFLSALFNTSLSNPPDITLNDNFLRSEESPSYIRTAYWNKVDRLTLTRLSIRIKYRSETPERFRLPYLSHKDHEDLRIWLQNISSENEIRFSEKAWWKPF